MSINGALKNLITKLGGTATKKTTEGLINEIADNVSGGGDGGGGGVLPIASADTLGGVKVGDGLSITEGGVLSATEHQLVISEANGVLDKTFAEIYTALNSGIPCYIKYANENDPDLDSTYSYKTVLSPVVQAFKYDDQYRVYAVDSYPFAMLGSLYYIGTPNVLAYYASNSSGYPTFIGSVAVKNSSIELHGNEH